MCYGIAVVEQCAVGAETDSVCAHVIAERCAQKRAGSAPEKDVTVVDHSGLKGIVVEPLPKPEELNGLNGLSIGNRSDPQKGTLEDMVFIRRNATPMKMSGSSVMDPEVLNDAKKSHRQKRCVSAILKDSADKFYLLLKEFADAVSADPPSVLPPDRGVRHEIDLEPGIKYCTTRQWPFPKKQDDSIDALFSAKHVVGAVYKSKSPHSSPTLCVRKPNRKWRMVHAFHRLNAATISASWPILHKDVLQITWQHAAYFVRSTWPTATIR